MYKLNVEAEMKQEVIYNQNVEILKFISLHVQKYRQWCVALCSAIMQVGKSWLTLTTCAENCLFIGAHGNLCSRICT